MLLAGTALIFVTLVFLGVRHYGGNVSALLHMDVPFGERHQVPEGLVLYTDAAYDGMLYYQVARDLPALVSGQKPSLDSPYRFQRILLPVFAYAVVLGKGEYLPYALLLINLAAAIGSFVLMLLITKKPDVHALTVVLNPAILVGVLYSLTEPLSLFFMMVFFFIWEKRGRTLDILSIGALFLSLFARETTVFLIALLCVWFVWNRQWKQAFLVALPVLPFLLWQQFLTMRLGAVPFQANSNIMNIPFRGPLYMIKWIFSDDGIQRIYRLSSLGLLFFLVPLTAMLGKEWIDKKKSIGLYAFLLSGLTVIMFTMDAHMWGAITSIGRVVTPLYPVYALYAAERDTRMLRAISVILILVSLVAAVGIASVPHPFVLS